MWNVLSTFLGSSSDPVQSLLDLAELGTSGEIQNDGIEDLDEEAVELVQWLQGIEPVKRCVTKSTVVSLFNCTQRRADCGHFMTFPMH